MIKLQAISKPVELTDDVARKLTEKYKTTQADVWKQRYITEALLKMQDEVHRLIEINNELTEEIHKYVVKK